MTSHQGKRSYPVIIFIPHGIFGAPDKIKMRTGSFF